MPNNTNQHICYWCGLEVKKGEGGREHIIPITILQDSENDISDFILPKENAHKECNKMLADNYEHDFGQIIFHYSHGDPRAKKHVESKIRNLKRKPKYVRNQFAKMRKSGNHVEIELSKKERESFEKVIEKIIKGLYLKRFGQFLDLKKEYRLKINDQTMNLEKVPAQRLNTSSFLKLINSVQSNGDDIFKYRVRKTEDGNSYLWELVFYNRFPIYMFLIHRGDEWAFNRNK